MQTEKENNAVEVVDVVKKFGETAAVDHVSLNIREGEFFSLLGPSGCGKTTTLRMIAGFEHPTSGEIYIEGTPVAGVPPFRRNVNTVFQSYALFPHMTVAENVAFGLEATRAGSKEQIAERVQAALSLVRLGNYGKRRPRQMSGGQQQRVALARALVNHPAVLLLDEPLGALDLKLRKEMQIELKNLQTQVGITFIYVTHDQEEALTMSDRIAVMSNGKVLQVGSPAEIYERPNCRFVADFIGQSNFLQGKVTTVADDLVTVAVGSDAGGFVVRSPRLNGVQAGNDVTLAVRPEKINLIRSDAAHEFSTNGQNRAVGRIERAIYMGTTTQYVVNLPGEVSLTVERQNGGIGVPSEAASYKQGRLVAPSEDGGRFVEHEEVVLEWSPAVTLLLEQ